MQALADEPAVLVLRAYGRTVGLGAPADALAAARELLPPSYRVASGHQPERCWSIVAGDGSAWQAAVEGTQLSGWTTLSFATDILLSNLEVWVAEHARRRVFVHAGCVVVGGSALLLPGRSISGKTTLTAALARAGAEYYSDEYAVLDHDGAVRPYARRLVLRASDGAAGRVVPVEELAGGTGRGPARVALVAALQYHARSGWNVEHLTRGQTVLRLLENAVAAQSRPRTVLAALEQATGGVLAVSGTRGDADEAASSLLAMLSPA